MNLINGRPDDWINPFHCMDRHIKTKHDIYEAGASAMLAVLIKWLDGSCKEHPLLYRFESFNLEQNKWNTQERVNGYPEYRYLCPQCMAELKESVK